MWSPGNGSSDRLRYKEKDPRSGCPPSRLRFSPSRTAGSVVGLLHTSSWAAAEGGTVEEGTVEEGTVEGGLGRWERRRVCRIRVAEAVLLLVVASSRVGRVAASRFLYYY